MQMLLKATLSYQLNESKLSVITILEEIEE
jgi:hypothetical protein